MSEFPALHWKTPSPLPTSLFIAFHSPRACQGSTVVRNIYSAPVNRVPTAGTQTVLTEGQLALHSSQHQGPGTLGKRLQHVESCSQPLPISRTPTGAPMGQPRALPASPWWAQPPAQDLAHSAPQHIRAAATGHIQLFGGRHGVKVAPLCVFPANGVRCCIHAGESLLTLQR